MKISLIINVIGGMVEGVYTDAPPDQEIDVMILDEDNGAVDENVYDYNTRLIEKIDSDEYRELAI